MTNTQTIQKVSIVIVWNIIIKTVKMTKCFKQNASPSRYVGTKN